MANQVPSTVPASVEVSYSEPGLFVGVQIYDDSGSSPVQVTGLAGMVGNVLPLLNWVGVAYRFKHQGTPGKFYLYQIAVYTDDTYATVDTDEPQGSDSLYFEPEEVPSGGSSNSGGIVGFVSAEINLVGEVRD